MKTRIIERISPDGSKSYVIQQKHFLFRWMWVNAWINSSCGADCRDEWSSLKEAQENMCYFDGTESTYTVMEK